MPLAALNRARTIENAPELTDHSGDFFDAVAAHIRTDLGRFVKRFELP
jgi:hypothetical protein